MHQPFKGKPHSIRVQDFPDIFLSLFGFCSACQIWNAFENVFLLKHCELCQIRKKTYVSVEFLQRSHWCKLRLRVYYEQPAGKYK